MNAFRQTKDRSLDRQYLRVAAVYRCIARFGMERGEALARLSERMPARDAEKLLSIWAQVPHLRAALKRAA